MSRVIRVAAAAAILLLPTAAVAYEATTTRIETRAFYGATVTLEAGVRVFRALPPHSKVIINPGGKTPVTLGFEENRNYNYNYNRGSSSDGGNRDDNDSDNGGSYSSGLTDNESKSRNGSAEHTRSGRGAPKNSASSSGPIPQRVTHPGRTYHHTQPAKH